MVEPITKYTPKHKNRLDKRYTVLSLDGGGVRALMTTMILANIEEQINSKKTDKTYKITDSVDSIIGTSAGGLVAIALAAGFSACYLRDKVMKDMIPETFSHGKNFIEKWFEPAYDERNLEQ